MSERNIVPLDNNDKLKGGNNERLISAYPGYEPVTLDYMPSQQAFPASKVEKVIYLLFTLSTHEHLSNSGNVPLNICLVVDQSSSMRGEKLFALKSAAKQVVDQLANEDFFSLISFNDRATVVVGCQRVDSRENIKMLIDSIEAKGGTELAQGLNQGIMEMKRATNFTELNHLMLFTDGQTYGDSEQCVYLGMEAARNNISIHPMGIGTDWNEDLLETVAAKTASSSEFINSADQIIKIFLQKIAQFRATLTNNATLIFQPVQGIKIRNAHRIVPTISEMEIIPGNNKGELNLKLGVMRYKHDYKVLIELLLPTCPPGVFRVGDFSLRYTPIEAQKNTVHLKLPVGITIAEPIHSSPINPEVKSILEKITTFKLQAKAWQDLSSGDIEGGKKKLAAVGTKLLNMGESILASQVEQELNNLEVRGIATAEGKKRIKYGTRGLTGLFED
ncbi:MAG: VWA domain-containing protein [Chloroflexi bacterium]|uniref:VWA domain-containing protein n=1 Tax=Candidatus Chlorohelix allophototropha TaxID=3003348 RepID=A0A8T7M8I7_9CHLR|nr:VWA domain-containing protein [Chloroflexota bacterium]WJW68298.1 VWA domain-containing protein [Chloroflexota bacterium L227-S17]